MLHPKVQSFLRALLVAGVCAVPASAKDTGIKQLYVFTCGGGTCPNGETPTALLLSVDGNFYGVTGNGGTGANAAGTVFRLSPDDQLTTLYTFRSGDAANGAWPTDLVEGSDGNVYGTTIGGGTYNSGVVFRVDKSGNFTLLHSICPSCGEGSDAEFLVAGNDANFYGDAYGELFRISASGDFKVLHNFDSATEGPDGLGLALGRDGNFYGTALGGQTLISSLFRLTPSGQFTVLQTFHYSQFPATPPVAASDGRLYGVLTHDADDDDAGLFRSNLKSSKFQIPALQGRGLPQHLAQSADGLLWGNSYAGTAYPNGALFAWSTKGKLLHQIVLDGTNGANPDAPLIQTSDGTLIGTAATGGTVSGANTAAGTIFAVQ